jgi:hypothetical protein
MKQVFIALLGAIVAFIVTFVVLMAVGALFSVLL